MLFIATMPMAPVELEMVSFLATPTLSCKSSPWQTDINLSSITTNNIDSDVELLRIVPGDRKQQWPKDWFDNVTEN